MTNNFKILSKIQWKKLTVLFETHFPFMEYDKKESQIHQNPNSNHQYLTTIIYLIINLFHIHLYYFWNKLNVVDWVATEMHLNVNKRNQNSNYHHYELIFYLHKNDKNKQNALKSQTYLLVGINLLKELYQPIW